MIALFWIAIISAAAMAITATHALQRRGFSPLLDSPEGRCYRSNCFFFALEMWWHHGGYVPIRKSTYWWGPHLMWSPDLLTFYDFTPVEPKRKRVTPPLRFLGIVRVWDAPEPS